MHTRSSALCATTTGMRGRYMQAEKKKNNRSNMKQLILNIILLFIFSCTPKTKSVKNQNRNIDFSQFNKLTCTPGISNTEKAKGFLEVYNQNSNNQDFENQLIAFLNGDECVVNYKYVSMFVKPKNGYTEIDDYQLAEKVLLNALKRVESKKDDDAKYDKCSFLWDITILYFENQKITQANKYAKLIKNEKSMNCGGMFPALEEKEREKFLEFYNSIE